MYFFALRPSEQTVEFLLLVQLHGDHHAVGHALGARVKVLDIGHVGHVVPYLEIDLVRAVEDLLEDALELRVDILLRIPHFREDAAVLMRLESALGPRLQFILGIQSRCCTKPCGHRGHHDPPEN